MIIPTLETQRLRLRAHVPEDLEGSVAMWGHPEVTKYIGGRPFTREEVWARLLRYAGHWVWMGFGFWAIEIAGTGQFIGEIGLAEYKRDMLPPLEETSEAGWALIPEAHGLGYATEALRAVVEWNDSQLKHPKIGCVIHPDNAASIKVAQKCGFAEVRRAIYRGQIKAVYVR